MFIVALPFGVLHGGYWGILAMVGISHICCHTGKILVECLYEPCDEGGEFHVVIWRNIFFLGGQEPVKVRFSYKEIAQEVFGKTIGGNVVLGAQIIELLMTCILYVVLCGDLMMGAFNRGPVDTRSYMMAGGLVLLPCAFSRTCPRSAAWASGMGSSMWSSMQSSWAFALIHIGTWGWTKVSLGIDILSFPIALGVIVFSYTSQIFLPTLEGNMLDKSKFHCMLNWSHIAAAIFKALFGYVGFLTFQEGTFIYLY